MSTLGEEDSSTLHPGATIRSEKARKEYEAEKQREAESLGMKGNNNQTRANTSEVGIMTEDIITQSSNKGGQQQEKTVSEFAKELEAEEEEQKTNNNKQKNKKD